MIGGPRLAVQVEALGHTCRWARVQVLEVAARALDGIALGLDSVARATDRSSSPELWVAGDLLGAIARQADRAGGRTHEAWLAAGLAWERRLPADRLGGFDVFAALVALREQAGESGTTQEVQI